MRRAKTTGRASHPCLVTWKEGGLITPMNIGKNLQRAFKTALGLLLLGSIVGTAHAQDQKKYLMVAMGDSITAGFIANTHVHTLSTDYVLNFPPFTNKKSDSWASGKSIISHYFQLQRFLEKSGDSTPVEMLDVADPGDEIHDVIAQAKRVKAAMDSGNYETLKYVVLLIGANDACAKKAPFSGKEHKMRKSLEEIFGILSEIHQQEPIRILVAGIPNIPDLAQPQFAETKTAFGMTCHFFQEEILKDCNPLLNWKSKEDYEKRVAVVEHTNQILEDGAHEASAAHPNLQVVFTDQLFKTAIQPEFLAADCFHPSREGQETISSTLWAQQAWFSTK
jgi:lysophospholipase L1-like esterase